MTSRAPVVMVASALLAAIAAACGSPGARSPSGGALLLDVVVGERGPILEWRSREIARFEFAIDDRVFPLAQDAGDPTRFSGAVPGLRASLTLREIGRGAFRAEVAVDLAASRVAPRLALRVHPEIGPIEEGFAPAIVPSRRHVIPDRLFRSPHAIVRSGDTVLALVPDVDLLARSRPAPAFLAFRPRVPLLEYGFAPSRPDGLGFFELARDERSSIPAGEHRFAATLLVSASPEDAENPRRRAADFLWRSYGRPRFASAESSEPVATLFDLVLRANAFAFDAGADVAWHRFTRDGRDMGGVAAAVAPDARALAAGGIRPAGLSIENRLGACAAANAVGLALHARDLDGDGRNASRGTTALNGHRREQARLVMNLALAAPSRGGLFPAVLAARDDGHFETGTWRAGPDARPPGHERFVHLPSAARTARAFIDWVRDVPADVRDPADDPRCLEAARGCAEALRSLQREDGSFPSWVHEITLFPSPVDLPAEGAASVAFLASLSRSFGGEVDLDAARRGGEFLLHHVLGPSRLEDAETHYSIAPQNRFKTRGVRDPETGLFASGTSAVALVAEAFLELAASDPDDAPRWLAAAERALDALALAQTVWTPAEAASDSSRDAFGSFPVTNADDAPADARAGRFALVFLEGYRATGREEYFERGVAALRAGFATMLAPDGPEATAAAREGWATLAELDLRTSLTIDGPARTPAIRFDRDAGGAAAAAAIVRARFGDVYVDVERGRAFAVDAVAVTRSTAGDGFAIRDLSEANRDVRVVWSTGESRKVALAAGGGESIPIRP